MDGLATLEGLAGIYFIINLINGKIYVGGAIELRNRYYSHFLALKNNEHGNIYLQRSYDIYGAEAFQFTVVEFILNPTKAKLLEIEQLWLDASDCCNPEIGYNILSVAGSPLGVKYSDDYKIRMSNRLKGKIKSDEWQANIKEAILKSPKQFKNKRNSSKWPHEKGIRCSCNECKEKLRESMRNRHHNKRHMMAVKAWQEFRY